MEKERDMGMCAWCFNKFDRNADDDHHFDSVTGSPVCEDCAKQNPDGCDEEK